MLTARPLNIRFSCGKEAKFIRYGFDIVTRNSKGKTTQTTVENKDKLIYLYTKMLEGSKAPSLVGNEVTVTLKYLNALLSTNLLTVL